MQETVELSRLDFRMLSETSHLKRVRIRLGLELVLYLSETIDLRLQQLI